MTSSLLPIRIIQLDPANLGTMDVAYVGTGDNSIDYAIKTIAKTPKVPAAEWICHELAGLAGVATPQYNVVEVPGEKDPAFGSQWDASVLTDAALMDALQLGTKPPIAPALSKIYAFDLFVGNPDRHLKNYLVTSSKTGTSVRAFDFSRAFTASGWPILALPLPAACKTTIVSRLVRMNNPFDLKAAEVVLDAIDKIPVVTVKNSLEKMPPPWMSKNDQKNIVRWWSDGTRQARTNQIRKGLQDASLL